MFADAKLLLGRRALARSPIQVRASGMEKAAHFSPPKMLLD